MEMNNFIKVTKEYLKIMWEIIYYTLKYLFYLIKYCVAFWSTFIVVGMITLTNVFNFIDTYGHKPDYPWNWICIVSITLFTCFCSKIIADLITKDDE
jgi:hypothetical protein